MELLVGMLVEALIPLVELAALLLCEVLALMISLIFGLIELAIEVLALVVPAVARFAEKRKEAAAAKGATEGAPSWRERIAPWTRIAGRVALGGAVVSILGIAIANWFFFETILRWQLAKVEAKTGIAITFESATGSLWSARAEMSGVKFRRSEHAVMRFDLEARELVVDGSLLNLRHVEECRLVGVRGRIERAGNAPEPAPRDQPFRIDRFEIRDSRVEVSDTRKAKPVRAVIELESFVCEPLHSDWLVFDTFFRAQVAGKIDGQPFSIQSRVIADGRETEWHAKGVPATLLAPYLGTPLTWVTQGSIDLDVIDRWRTKNLRAEPLELVMDWKVVLRDVRVALPEDLSKTERAVAMPMAALVNAGGKELPLAFSLKLDAGEFQFAASAEVAGLWKAVGEALAEQLAKEAGVPAGEIKKAAGQAWDAFKKGLKKNE
jgi:hypothetical protein